MFTNLLHAKESLRSLDSSVDIDSGEAVDADLLTPSNEASQPGYQTIVCPITRMTDQEKDILVSSWKRMVGSNQDEFNTLGRKFAKDLMLWMLDNIPKMRSLFHPMFGEKEGIHSRLFMIHVILLLNWINVIVSNVKKPTKLDMTIMHLALKHLNMCIGVRYFNPWTDQRTTKRSGCGSCASVCSPTRSA
ncbi:globin-like isoform X2 [Physella acuta]|uniref:globin-like isoform X2 n=1 Tax=Physella acuta TaxID=109671 RepID=UPI0027DCFAF6|nr:globin-like isoform X2 [Physella acuta]